MCYYEMDPQTGRNNGCRIFKLKDLIEWTGGNFTRWVNKENTPRNWLKTPLLLRISWFGGVGLIRIQWNCNLDLDFLTNCLPVYKFSMLDSHGWNFRDAHYHDENKRTLRKLNGLKVNLSNQKIENLIFEIKLVFVVYRICQCKRGKVQS